MKLRRVVYIDMDDVIANFKSSFESYNSSNPEIRFPQGEIGFFENLRPIEYAIDAVNDLRQRSDFNVYILTAPSTRNVHSYSEKRIWVENNFDYEFTKRLIICSEKNLLKGDYLIDDNTNGKGQEDFSGELIHFGSKQYPNWRSVMSYLLKNI